MQGYLLIEVGVSAIVGAALAVLLVTHGALDPAVLFNLPIGVVRMRWSPQRRLLAARSLGWATLLDAYIVH